MNLIDFPDKWREMVDPFTLKYNHFKLTEVLGYPHAGNDVFYAKGIYNDKEVYVIIKVNRQVGADIENEIDILQKISFPKTPIIIDYDKEKTFRVSLVLEGEKLSTLLGKNIEINLLDYLEEYGRMLGKIHNIHGDFNKVKDRKFFHLLDKEIFFDNNMEYIYNYLINHKPKNVNECFCHGDFHYANILWKNGHISGILDFELSGIGNREFDIAWAIIIRPGQEFLKREIEVEAFLKGYSAESHFEISYVKYYMALIYTWFYFMGDNDYKNYVINWLKSNCISKL